MLKKLTISIPVASIVSFLFFEYTLSLAPLLLALALAIALAVA